MLIKGPMPRTFAACRVRLHGRNPGSGEMWDGDDVQGSDATARPGAERARG